ncbi:uncharacterized protein [Panulirus ornatus]|uniref:uncharacterized protein n=1 Tax=Panulirus ornatus TaxID=150431 RepID=UPI003A836BBE
MSSENPEGKCQLTVNTNKHAKSTMDEEKTPRDNFTNIKTTILPAGQTKQIKVLEDHQQTTSEPVQHHEGEHLPSFEEENKWPFIFFRLCCIFAIRKKYGRYVMSNVMFIIFYILWVAWPLTGFTMAVYSASLFPGEQSHGNIQNEVLESSLFILCFGVVPALQAYSLKFINKCLPQVLEDISLLCCIKVGFETPLKVCRITKIKKSKERLKQAVNGEFPLRQYTQPEHLFHWLPLSMIVVSVFVFLTVWIIGFLVILDANILKKECSALAINFAYQCLPFVTTILVIFFIKWHTQVYQELQVSCNDTSAAWSTSQIHTLCTYVITLQDIFVQLSDGFFRYTLGINMITITISAIVCTAKILEDSNNFIYVEPLIGCAFILTIICEKSSALMDKYEKLLLLLKMKIRHHQRSPHDGHYEDLLLLRENLLESPPQVVTCGGYRCSRGLLVTLFGFILSYAVLFDQIAHPRSGIHQDTINHILLILRNMTDDSECFSQCLTIPSPSPIHSHYQGYDDE